MMDCRVQSTALGGGWISSRSIASPHNFADDDAVLPLRKSIRIRVMFYREVPADAPGCCSNLSRCRHY